VFVGDGDPAVELDRLLRDEPTIARPNGLNIGAAASSSSSDRMKRWAASKPGPPCSYDQCGVTHPLR
jgi:hypothetical protein